MEGDTERDSTEGSELVVVLGDLLSDVCEVMVNEGTLERH